MYLKEGKIKDRKYLDTARDKCCLVCGSRHGVVMHHLRCSSYAGTGTKAGDDKVIPLCSRYFKKDGCHDKIHNNEKQFLNHYKWIFGEDPIAFAKLLYKRYLTNRT